MLRQVTLIGHNNQLMPLANLFAGAHHAVRIYTSDHSFEELLAPYPGIEVTLVQDGYATRPVDLPESAYFICIDKLEIAQQIRAWLPPILAIFHVKHETRRQVNAQGFLRLGEPESQIRSNLLRRLDLIDRVDHLMDLARHSRSPLVLMYADPDPDAIGAALGLATIFRHAGVDPRIRYTGEVQRYQNKLMLSYLDESIERLSPAELADTDLIAVVDAQPSFWKKDPPRADIIIDHHPNRDACEATFTDIRPDYGATSSIIIEYLHEVEIPIRRNLATALLYGIVTDTNELTRDTASADIQAYDIVHGKADQYFISRLHKSVIPLTMLDALSWGIGHRLVIRDLMVVHFGEVDNPDLLVQAADFLLLTRGISWVVCAAKIVDRLVIIFRGDGHHQDVGLRARNAFGRLGSAGGHRTMGRAEVLLGGEHVDATIDILIDNLCKRMSTPRRTECIRILRNHLHGPGPQAPAELR